MTDWARTERYKPPRVGDVELAQRLLDDGLLTAVNALVLHRLGLALGVIANDGVVTGLTLHATDDPEGIVFADRARAGVLKLREAGHEKLAARVEGVYRKKDWDL